MYGYKAILFTQLGFKFRETFNIIESLNTLLNFTKYSVENQTNKNFIWCFLVGELLTDTHIDIIKRSVKDIELVFLRINQSGINNCESNDINYFIEKYIYDIIRTNEYISFRLDADDYMHPQLLDIVSKNLTEKYSGENMVICNPTLGYMLYPKMKIFIMCDIHSIAIGQGIISNKDGSHIITHKKHNDLKNNLKKDFDVDIEEIKIKDRPLYIYTRTDNSYSYTQWEKMKHRYIISNNIEQDAIQNIIIEFKMENIL